MRKLTVLAYVFGGAALVLNPAACYHAEAPFQFGADEMKAALAGTWEITPDGGTPRRYRIEQGKAMQSSRSAGLVSDAAACSHRSLVASASACGDSTDMPVLLVALDGVGKPLTGELSVYGKSFIAGYLHIDTSGQPIRATLSPAGDVIRVEHATIVRYR